MRNTKAFTLIELVMVIVILAVLAAVAIPIYVDLRTEARVAAEEGVVGGVRAGILTYYVDPARGDRTDYPTILDDAANSSTASDANPFFISVLSQGGITSGWSKDGSGNYVGPTSVSSYSYTSATGEFTKI